MDGGLKEEASLEIILADTNIAFILYFFASKGLIPWKEIVINHSAVRFHPIVLGEISAQYKAWTACRGLGAGKGIFPDFFDILDSDGIEKIISFVKENLAVDLGAVDTCSSLFSNKRKMYEAERTRLQEAWKKAGAKGRKVTSKPSINDYSILFSAEISEAGLLTNDEILLSIAQEFLDEGFTYRAEDLIATLTSEDGSHLEAIEEVASTLAYLKIGFVLAKTKAVTQGST